MSMMIKTTMMMHHPKEYSSVQSEEERPGMADSPGHYNRFLSGKGGPAAALQPKIILQDNKLFG
jgi:hypothetical protein